VHRTRRIIGATRSLKFRANSFVRERRIMSVDIYQRHKRKGKSKREWNSYRENT
jgi:hypothetical protein